MKLLLIFAAILAFSVAKEDKKREVLEDSQAEASSNLELMKEGADLNVAASTYNSYVPPSQRPPKWESPNYVPPQNTWQPPKPIQPVHTGVPANVQSDYYPSYQPPSTTTPAVEVIKNEQYFGENGHYKYEYKIADGTWVGEEGYYTDPKQTEESLVKKGWYSFVGADGKTYTTTYWADKSGYHAFGDHLPTPPPPAAQQPDKNKPQYDEYPTQTQKPVYYPTQTPAPVYYPTKAPYIPSQQPFQPPQQYFPPQPFPQAPVVPSLPTYQPPLQQYYPPQQNYYPQQPNNQL